MFVTEQLLEAYLDRLKARRAPSEHTIRAYRADLRDYLSFVQQDKTCAADQLILRYVRHLMVERKAAIRTTRRRVACLRGYYGDLVRTRMLAKSPFSEIELQLPKPKTLPRSLARDDAVKLADQAWRKLAADTLEGRQVAIAVLLLLSVGLRVGELVQLRPLDFDAQDGGLHVRGKGRRERKVPVIDVRLRAQLAKLIDLNAEAIFEANGRPWSTQLFRQLLRTFAKHAGILRRVTPHMLRHTSATLLLEDGVDILFLQKLLGHENIATTALYAHVADASLKKALQQARLLDKLVA